MRLSHLSTNSFILTLNAGSSSIKFALFEAENSATRGIEGVIERIGLPNSSLRVKSADPSKNSSRSLGLTDHHSAVKELLSWIVEQNLSDKLKAVGHRIVHGGASYSEPQLITTPIVEELRRLIPLDPEHLPQEILLIEALQNQFPHLPQVACFDTAFHRDLPRVAQLLAIPRRYEAKGIRRYGFHGLSCQFLMREIARLDGPEASQGKIILAHLGNGSSLTGVHKGRSIDTSMGLTTTSGVLMGSRSGDLDPGVLCYLAESEGLNPSQLREMINSQSGLLGISETSSDMRDLLNCEKNDIRAAEAIELYCYQVKKWIGAYAAALNGLDTIVFSGGIAENSPSIRSRICNDLQILGVELDENSNNSSENLISSKNSQVKVRTIHTDEEWILANSVYQLLR